MIVHIVAHDLNQAIGCDNQLLWHLPDDLKRFKELTTGNTVIMGRKTFESIGKPLLNRRNIILTRSDFKHDGVDIYSNIDEALNTCGGDVFIIGGGEIYKQTMHLAYKIELTLVNREVKNADTFYPVINLNEFEITDRILNDEYDFITYERKL